MKGLRSKPLWSSEETGLENKLKEIQKNWETIRDEALNVLESKSKGFEKYYEYTKNAIWDPNLKEPLESRYNVWTTEFVDDKWENFTLFENGAKSKENCYRMPLTCSLFEKIQELNTNTCKDICMINLRFVQRV